MECGFIELTDRGLSCEFNNIFTADTSNINIIETNTSIEAIIFRQSELYKVPQDIFVKFSFLKHLDVELTQLKVIEADNFRGASELKYFLARFNNVTKLNDEIFVFAPKLKFIVLQYNKITNIKSKAFKGLKHLEALYLDYNQISSLPSDILVEVPNLLHFSVAYNNLTEIPDGMFETSGKLETLNFGHNLLTYFNDTHFDSLPNLERLQLERNYFKKLDLVACKSTEINVDRNNLEVIELNKWTRVVTAWGNPVKKLILHEHYGAGRSYNFSFAQVNEIVFFVNEHCCTVENLENFNILMSSFGDLSKKNLTANDWMCIFLKSVGYETPNGFVVNNVCTRINQPVTSHTRILIDDEVEITSKQQHFEQTTDRVLTSKDYDQFDDLQSSTYQNIFSIDESSSTEENAFIEEILSSTTEKISAWNWQSFKGSVKSAAKDLKDKAKETWKDVKNSTTSWWSG